jgi:hypothetical protein
MAVRLPSALPTHSGKRCWAREPLIGSQRIALVDADVVDAALVRR